MATIGAVFGAIVINLISCNRKYLFSICLFISHIGALLFVLAPNYSSVLAGMFLAGFGSN